VLCNLPIPVGVNLSGSFGCEKEGQVGPYRKGSTAVGLPPQCEGCAAWAGAQ
jgi:hypothetical protein